MNRLHLAILRAASCLAPNEDRAEWLDEWKAELFYVLRARTGYRAAAFCLGAFRDAWWLRRNNLNPAARRMLRLETPLQCLSFLAVLAAASLLFALRLPGVRNLILPTPYRDVGGLVMVSSCYRTDSVVAVPVGTYRRLEERAGHWFSEFAFYQPMVAAMRTDRGRLSLPVARATGNLFDLLGISIGQARQQAAALVLTRTAWRKYFHADPHIEGRVVEVSGQPAAVAAVISEDSWRLPGRVDAWLLEDRQQIAASPQPSGFVLAHVRPSERPRNSAGWHIYVAGDDGEFDRFGCAPLQDGHPVLAIVAMILLSCLVVPATTTLALGEYPADCHRLPWTIRLRRWLFLTVKIALVVPIVFCGSLDLGAASHASLQPNVMIVGSVLAFRWILTDQRRRCPVCLRLLTNPVRIGRLSQTFLEWYGTELMCLQGHGLLHVPEVETSCYGVQRWLYLDASWSGLFSEPAGMRQ